MMKNIGIILTSALALLMINLDATAVNIVIPTLMNEFGITSERASITVLAYLLGMVGTALLFGKLADRIGQGKIFTGGYLLFLVGSILCALSWDLLSLSIFRFIQGIGGAMVVATSAAIIVKFLSSTISGRAYGINGMMAGLGFALGSPLGGMLSEAYGWRAIFLINIPVSLLGVALCFIFLKGESVQKNLHRFDKLGALISFLFLTSIVLLLEGGKSTIQMVLLALFALFLFIVFIKKGKVHHDPILDFKLFKSKSFSSSVLALSSYYILLMGNAFVLPLFLQKAKGMSVSEAGNLLFISPIICLVLSPVAGYLSDRFSSKLIAGIGAILFVFTSLLFFNLYQVNEMMMIISFVLYGVALSLFITPMLNIVMNHSTAHNAGAISAIKGVIPNLFGLIGVGVYATLYSRFYWGNAGKLIEVDAAGTAFSSVMMLSLVVSIACAGFLVGARNNSHP